MLICDNGIIREMTPEEEYIANHIPDPEDIATAEEIVEILTGEEE